MSDTQLADNQAKTSDKKFECLECANEIEVPSDKTVGDFFECDFCGIEYEIVEETDDGEFIVQIVEEEK